MLKFALRWLAAGLALGGWGVALLNGAGPCTLHLAFGGLGLIGIGGVCCVFAIAELVAALRSSKK